MLLAGLGAHRCLREQKRQGRRNGGTLPAFAVGLPVYMSKVAASSIVPPDLRCGQPFAFWTASSSSLASIRL